MITQQENDLLTRTDKSTPAGEMIRRYWQPVALVEELPQGGPPLPVKILGEELALFRDDQGRPGLLGLHCSHRGTDLSYGRVENGGLRCLYHGWVYDIKRRCLEQPGEPNCGEHRDSIRHFFHSLRQGGLRCLYHGWLYDIKGRCLEQPGEPNCGEHRDSIRHLSYPCREAGGAIFAYMGPGEAPELPNYEFLTVAAERCYVNKIYHECNYLQGNEGNIDPVHLSYLHRFFEVPQLRYTGVRNTEDSHYSLVGRNLAPSIDVELTDFGVRIYTARTQPDGKVYLRVSYFVLPNLSAFPGQTGGEGYSVNWHVPIDDKTHWKYSFVFSSRAPLKEETIARSRSELTADYRLIRNKANRFMQDRESMTTKTYTGMGIGFQAHDAFATSSQGAIQDRSHEHLVSSDKAIVAARKLMT